MKNDEKFIKIFGSVYRNNQKNIGAPKNMDEFINRVSVRVEKKINDRRKCPVISFFDELWSIGLKTALASFAVGAVLSWYVYSNNSDDLELAFNSIVNEIPFIEGVL